MNDYDLTYVAFGAGVQSTALLILSAQGKAPKADVAIFADTQAEIPATYAHIERMKAWSTERGIPVRIVTAGSLEADTLGTGGGKSQVSIPAFIKNADGSRGIQRRQCTYDYKLMPLMKAAREECGLLKGQRAKGVIKVQALLGISKDEAQRMKDSRIEWSVNAYPLVDLGLTRADCVKIIQAEGIALPPRSSCYFCPYHRAPYWRYLRDNDADSFARAIDFDNRIRRSRPKLIGESYIHDSLTPLSGVDFDKKDPQISLLDGFGNECEGMCGV